MQDEYLSKVLIKIQELGFNQILNVLHIAWSPENKGPDMRIGDSNYAALLPYLLDNISSAKLKFNC